MFVDSSSYKLRSLRMFGHSEYRRFGLHFTETVHNTDGSGAQATFPVNWLTIYNYTCNWFRSIMNTPFYSIKRIQTCLYSLNAIEWCVW